MKFVSRLLFSIAATATVTAYAADQGAHIDLYPTPASTTFSGPETISFWDRFKVAFDRSAGDLFADRFHPLRVMGWDMKQSGASEDFLREHNTSVARNTFTDSGTYGIREAAVDAPFMMSLDNHQGFVADLIRNSVGNLGEEALSPANPSYRPLERSWWEGLSENGEVLYGFRPFRTNPYAFLSYGISDGDTQVLLGHIRYHYSHFADHSFEFAVSVPLLPGLWVDAGTSYQFGQHDAEQTTVLKFFKEFTGGGIAHVGLEMQGHPGLFAGLSFPL